MADSKLTALSEISVPALEDLLYLVDDPSGTPASAKVSVTRALGLLNHVCQGRLTLATGHAVYNPQPATPSATDTTAETCDFAAAHGWVTGTLCTPSATGGGLTAGTAYYLRAVDSDTVSFHTTLADAEANTSKVNLTASITAEIRPYGVQSTTVRFTPYNGNLISIYDGTRWRLYTFTELSLALGAVTSGLPYDIFVYDNSGTVTLEKVAWTNGTTRATALVLQDGVYVKSGDTTRRYLGTIYTVSTAATEDSAGGYGMPPAKRFVWNLYNPVRRSLLRQENTASWTYATSSWRQANASASNQVEFICGLSLDMVRAEVMVWGQSSTGSNAAAAIGLDSTSSPHPLCNNGACNVVATPIPIPATLQFSAVPGYHYLAWLESRVAGSATLTYYGNPSSGEVQSGIYVTILG